MFYMSFCVCVYVSVFKYTPDLWRMVFPQPHMLSVYCGSDKPDSDCSQGLKYDGKRVGALPLGE